MRWGDFRSVHPKSRSFAGRGTPIDRYYIEAFLAGHAADIHGVTLEVASDAYVRRFGGANVVKSEVVSIAPGEGVTIVGDLTQPKSLPRDHFDCIVLTQTLQFIYDVKAALSTLAAALKPGGVLLLTVPGISQISGYDERLTGDFWRFTPSSVQRLLEERFTSESVEVCGYGNVLTAIAFLHNVAQEELKKSELEASDAQYPMIVAARAVKEG
jgi:SAM-dependent methyltransferase